jgi:hypothetical protein
MEKTDISAASTNPTTGMERHTHVGIITCLIEAARRQETLIDALVIAVDSENEAEILIAARNLAANRRRDTVTPTPKRGGRSKPAKSSASNKTAE